jgi:hypothetical protein
MYDAFNRPDFTYSSLRCCRTFAGLSGIGSSVAKFHWRCPNERDLEVALPGKSALQVDLSLVDGNPIIVALWQMKK